MCLIVAKSSGVKIPYIKYLRNANAYNPHGIGIAYWKNKHNEVIIKKDFEDVELFIKWFKKHIRKSDACVIHFRFATSGLVDNGNRHPFPLTRSGEIIRRQNFKCKIAVAHNGVVSQYSNYSNKSQDKNKFSDTQLFIMDILQDPLIKQNLENKTIKKLLEDFVGNDKLAFINNNGNIIRFGDFKQSRGIYYSNESYKEETHRYSVEQSGDYGQQRTVVRPWENTSVKHYFENKCEGCGKVKLVCYRQINRTSALLCDGCEKKFTKNFENNEKEGIIECSNCQTEKSVGVMYRYGDQLICEECVIRLKMDY